MTATICVTRVLDTPTWSEIYVRVISPRSIPIDEEIIEVVSVPTEQAYATVCKIEDRIALNLTKDIIEGKIILPSIEQLGSTSGLVYTKYHPYGNLYYAYMPIHLYLGLLATGQELELTLDVANYRHINDILSEVKLMKLQIVILKKLLDNSNYAIDVTV